MQELSQEQINYMVESGFTTDQMEDLWQKIYDFRVFRLKTGEDQAVEDADEAIEALLTKPAEDECVCIDIELGSLIYYYGTKEFDHVFTADEKADIQNHIEECQLCQNNLIELQNSGNELKEFFENLENQF